MPGIVKYEDMERELLDAQYKQDNPAVLKCKKCGSTYFSEESFTQYKADHIVALGQRPPFITTKPAFIILKCVCGELYEVRTSRGPNKKANEEYDNFLDVVEKNNK